MKKILLASYVFIMCLAVQAQSTNYVAPSGTSIIATKADSLMGEAAAKLGVDTNASAQEIGEEIDTAISFIPGKHAGYLAWIKFLMKLFIPIVALYFFVKHQIVSAKLKSLTKVSAVLLLLTVGLGAQAQALSKERVNKYRGTVAQAKAKTAKALAPAVSGTGTIVYSTPSFGIGALVIQKSLSGWAATGTITPSFSYSIGCGQYTSNADGSLTIEPYVNLGAFVAAGIIPQSILSGSVQLGGSLGIYKYNSLAIGYDAITKKPFFALGASISLFTFKQGLGSSIIHLY